MVMGTIMGIDIQTGAKSMGHNYRHHNNNSRRNSHSDGSRKRHRTTIFPNKTMFLERRRTHL